MLFRHIIIISKFSPFEVVKLPTLNLCKISLIFISIKSLSKADYLAETNVNISWTFVCRDLEIVNNTSDMQPYFFPCLPVCVCERERERERMKCGFLLYRNYCHDNYGPMH